MRFVSDEAAFLRALGQVLQEHRARLDLSQEDLGFEAELDRTYISGVERGVRNITMKTLLRLCTALSTKPSSVLRSAELRIK